MCDLFQTFRIPDWRAFCLAMSAEMKKLEVADMLSDRPQPIRPRSTDPVPLFADTAFSDNRPAISHARQPAGPCRPPVHPREVRLPGTVARRQQGLQTVTRTVLQVDEPSAAKDRPLRPAIAELRILGRGEVHPCRTARHPGTVRHAGRVRDRLYLRRSLPRAGFRGRHQGQDCRRWPIRTSRQPRAGKQCVVAPPDRPRPISRRDGRRLC